MIPEIGNYGNYKSPNSANPNTIMVIVGGITVYYSYTTAVAFRKIGFPLVVSENCWGPTTGRHLNLIDNDKGNRLPRAEFEKQISVACNIETED